MKPGPATAPHSLLASCHSAVTLKGHLRKRTDLRENIREAGECGGLPGPDSGAAVQTTGAEHQDTVSGG